MNRPRLIYSVYDIKDEKYILTDGLNNDVVAKIGICKSKISDYVTFNRIYKGRYRITSCEIVNPKKRVPGLEIKEKLEITKEDRKVMNEFDLTMKYLQEHYSPKVLRRIVITRESPVG